MQLPYSSQPAPRWPRREVAAARAGDLPEPQRPSIRWTPGPSCHCARRRGLGQPERAANAASAAALLLPRLIFSSRFALRRCREFGGLVDRSCTGSEFAVDACRA